MKKRILPLFFFVLIVPFFSLKTESYLIYAIGQKVPSGAKNEVRSKNYFVNIGSAQGIKEGTLLSVYRQFSLFDPFHNNEQHSVNLKIGKLEVIHIEEETAIGKKVEFYKNDATAVQEYQDFMLGDSVNIYVEEKKSESKSGLW